MNRVIFATIALITAGAMTAAADSRDDALAAMKRCAALSDQQARLVCYDKVPQTHDQAAPPAAAIAEPAQPPRQERQGLLGRIFGNAPRLPQKTVAQFGSESLELNGESGSAARIKGDTINGITARMASFAISPTGVITVTLDNAQVWRQRSAGNFAHLTKPASHYIVHINRGSFGSYKMTISETPEVFDVERIR